jgi:hypothetical protein
VTIFIFFARERKDGVFRSVDSDLVRGQERDLFLRMSCLKPKTILVKVFCTFARTLMKERFMRGKILTKDLFIEKVTKRSSVLLLHLVSFSMNKSL